MTVRDQGLLGSSDKHLYEVCCEEKRCLVTLDLDFADVVRFPPAPTSGIVIIRVARNPTLKLLESLVQQFLRTLEDIPIDQKLWIVEVGRIRIHEPESPA
jgi:predicted nuclease of predicted toxin-antitoxin system